MSLAIIPRRMPGRYISFQLPLVGLPFRFFFFNTSVINKDFDNNVIMQSWYCILLFFSTLSALIQSEILWDELSCWFIDFLTPLHRPTPAALLHPSNPPNSCSVIVGQKLENQGAAKETPSFLNGLTIRQVIYMTVKRTTKKYNIFIGIVFALECNSKWNKTDAAKADKLNYQSDDRRSDSCPGYREKR